MSCLFTSFFQQLNDYGISYAITGRTEKYPEVIHSDIDIITPPSQIKAFWTFMQELHRQKINWIQVITHEITANYFVVTLSDGVTHQLIKPDVCSDYYRNGTLYLKAEYLLSNKVFNSKGFFQLAPDKEFVYYLFKKIEKGNINCEQFEHLLCQWNQDRKGCLEAIMLFFSKENLKSISKAFDQNDKEYLLCNFSTLKKGLHHNLKFRFKDFLSNNLHKIKRVFRPTGLVIAFMGPDGAGKTTIINGVKYSLTESFRQNKQYHLFPKESSDAMPTTDPHSLKSRGYVGSLIKLFYFLNLYLIGYWSKIYLYKVKSTLVIFDRYYHDMWVDPKRYRHGAGKAWIKLIGFFIPKPDLWILLDAPADIIQKRKTEVTLEETVRQVKAYQLLFSKLNNSFIVNANQSPDRVIYDAEEIIINYMKKRTASRYKNYKL